MTLEEINNMAESSSDHIEMLESEVEKLQAENSENRETIKRLVARISQLQENHAKAKPVLDAAKAWLNNHYIVCASASYPDDEFLHNLFHAVREMKK